MSFQPESCYQPPLPPSFSSLHSSRCFPGWGEKKSATPFEQHGVHYPGAERHNARPLGRMGPRAGTGGEAGSGGTRDGRGCQFAHQPLGCHLAQSTVCNTLLAPGTHATQPLTTAPSFGTGCCQLSPGGSRDLFGGSAASLGNNQVASVAMKVGGQGVEGHIPKTSECPGRLISDAATGPSLTITSCQHL